VCGRGGETIFYNPSVFIKFEIPKLILAFQSYPSPAIRAVIILLLYYSLSKPEHQKSFTTNSVDSMNWPFNTVSRKEK